MPTFIKRTLIAAPVEEVFAFHEREDALSLLSPPFPPIRIIRKEGGIEVGSRVELQIGPIRWVAIHSAFERNRLFEDSQARGPFALWRHRHEFAAAGSATQLTDHIEYRLPGGVWVNRLLSWVVELGLRRMFHYRHTQTRHYCERDSL